MEFNGDPTGFISHCMSELIKVGFDASAISLAKWVGVALLVAIFLAAAVTFYSRLRHGKDILPVLSDTHFKMILAAGLLLVVDVTAATAQAEAVKARLDVLEGNLQTIQVAMNQNPPSGTGQETSEALKGTTTAGATHILFTSQGAEHISDLEILLSEIELTASETHGPTPLRGTAIQLLLF